MEYVPLVKQVPKTQVREVQKQAPEGREETNFFGAKSTEMEGTFFLWGVFFFGRENILVFLCFFFSCQVGVPHYQARERVVEAALAVLR